MVTMNKYGSNNDYYVMLLEEAQNGNEDSLNELIIYIRDKIMKKRIGKYLYKNRQVEAEDIEQEFMIGVALNIQRADLNIGDPIEFLVQQGIYRVRSYMKKSIIKGTTQTCIKCGNVSRLNLVNGKYVCKKCGGEEINTQEVSQYDDGTLLNLIESKNDFEAELISNMLLDEFEKTLSKGTNVYDLFVLLRSGINRDNSEVKNYIKEIAEMWNCSQNNVVQNMRKLKVRIIQFAETQDMIIVNNKFITKE